MDLRQLRYFVAVAEELSFSRASARLHLAQSALSSQVRQLEAEVGGPLLRRTTRRVELTPAGEALLEQGREVLAAAEEALRHARALARGEAGVLTIGTLGPAAGGILAPLLARFGARHPALRMELRAFDFTETVAGVRDRGADCAFVYLPIDDPELEVTPLLAEPRIVVMSRGHRLAKRKRLRPAELAGETFVTHPETIPRSWRDHWLLVEENGHRPPISDISTPDKVEEWLHVIGSGAGIDTAPAIISRYYAWPEVAYVPLVGAAPATLAMIRRRDTPNPLVDELTELAVEISAHAAATSTPYSAAGG